MADSPAVTAPNGIKLVRVVAVDAVADEARIEIHFFNLNYLADLVAGYTADKTLAKRLFPISGGTRLRAGGALGQVQVDSSAAPATPAISLPVATSPVLVVRVSPIGDYSTYTLGVSASTGVFDPLFSEIGFKFRPGCFNSNCAPEWESAPRPQPELTIDYLAKDYASFRQTMIAAMMARVPGWEATSEADLDMVLADLFSAAADELSDFQDRVMNEAYLASARKRVSLARHARLMDYHIHQGSQASSWLALEIGHDVGPKQFQLREGLKAWAGESSADAPPKETANSVVFVSRHPTQTVHQYLNHIGLYTWSNTITTLRAGSTRADLKLYQRFYPGDGTVPVPDSTDAAAKEIQNLIRNGNIRRLLIQEHLNPETGLLPGRDPSKRQLLTLLGGSDPATAATALQDPVTGEWFVRVRWEKVDALQRDYCFRVDCPSTNSGTALGAVDNISLFHGNLVQVLHGRMRRTIFKDPESPLTNAAGMPLQLHYERTRWGAVCRIPEANLAYRNTLAGGDVPPVSTLNLTVQASASGPSDAWDEVASLIHSDDSAEQGDHFIVETDENRRSIIRFGNGRNGMDLPDGAVVTANYQFGEPLEGNVGADTIVCFDASTVVVESVGHVLTIRRCWNPFDVTNGKDREPLAEIIRRVPEAYRLRQLRAVTLPDYVARAEEVDGVARASARYAWTGSWRTVRITIDPAGTTELSDKLLAEVEAYLNAVRLIGEDIEVRPPLFVPLEIKVRVCIEPDVWPEDVRFVLEQEFSDGWTSDGRMGFFHPDLWTFGQPLHASQIIGRVLKVDGVEHVIAQRRAAGSEPPISVSIKRANSSSTPVESFTQIDSNEIILVLNDPDHMERGTITFELMGGRQ
ncbi:baseplate J/gp47 family protein [Aquincola sp. S2]|uniref:Baseplate J/gp47 family protein n=2 Tax=Pseudaquabacterium terrae TaxID=2732868 RepID=A0ABX2ESX0_9BURK|nr:baseplate J/gp47 family protein [Aquabacterium terrae]